MIERENEQPIEQGVNQGEYQDWGQETNQENYQEGTKEPPSEDQGMDQGMCQDTLPEEVEEVHDFGDVAVAAAEALKQMEDEYREPDPTPEEEEEEYQEEEEEYQEEPQKRRGGIDGTLGEVLEEAGEMAFDTLDGLKAAQCAKISKRNPALYKASEKGKRLFFKMIRSLIEEMELPDPKPWVVFLGVFVYVFGVPFIEAVGHRQFGQPPTPKRDPQQSPEVAQGIARVVEMRPQSGAIEETVEIVPEVNHYTRLEEYRHNRQDFRIYNDGSYKRANGQTTNAKKGEGGFPSPIVKEWIEEAQKQGLKGSELNQYVQFKLYGDG